MVVKCFSKQIVIVLNRFIYVFGVEKRLSIDLGDIEFYNLD